jgi:tetratricopeptide (TPR) repeat protein
VPASLSAALRNARLIAGVFLATFLLHGCALLLPQTTELEQKKPADLPERLELDDLAFFPQRDYQCGPAALATVLAAVKPEATLEALIEQVYLPARKGSLQLEMLTAPRRYGLVSYQLAPRFEDVLREVAAGNPVVVLQDYGAGPFSIWHYAVVAGYDFPKNELVLRSGEKRRLVMPLGILEYTWKGSGYWAMVAMPPERIPVTANEERYLTAIGAMERLGDVRAAKAAYTAFLGRWPDNLTAGIGLANAHYALGELADTEAVLRRLIERHPDSAAVLNNLAQTVSDRGRHTEALQLIERATALEGPFAAAIDETRAQILQRMGNSP